MPAHLHGLLHQIPHMGREGGGGGGKEEVERRKRK